MQKLKNLLFIALTLFILFSFTTNLLTPSADAQLLPQIPLPTAANGLLQTAGDTVNGVVPTVASVLNLGGDVSTVNKTVNNIITPPAQTQLPGNTSTNSQTFPQGSSTTTTSTTQYSATTDRTTSQLPQTINSNPNIGTGETTGSLATIPNGTDVLLLTHENTASGRIVLSKDINEVVFLADSLDPLRPPLVFIMPPERDVPILFNFAAFMQTDPTGQHVVLPQGIAMEQTAGDDRVTTAIPAGENIALSMSDCGSEQWDGTLTALTILPQNSVSLKGETVGVPIAIGRNDCSLELSKQASIYFANRADWHVGYRLQNQGDFTKIATLCPITTQRECYTDEGKNLLVNTYHFTEFIVYNNQTPLFAAFSFFTNANVIALILAIIFTLLLALILGNWRVLKKVGKIADIDERKSEYVSTVSHELRTPLTAIKGFISMIRGGDYGPVKETMEKPLKEVEVSAQRSIDMVNEVLDVSRIESGKVKLTLEAFPIDSLISEVIEFLMPIAVDKKLSLEATNLDKTSVQADKEKVRQLLINLITNAIKYTEHGSVSVSTKEMHDAVNILVTDTGAGIPSEQQEKLFKKFERINTNAERTGLGLYISKRLAHKMGGDIYLVKSEPNTGSTFALSLLKEDSKLAKQLLKKTKQ